MEARYKKGTDRNIEWGTENYVQTVVSCMDSTGKKGKGNIES